MDPDLILVVGFVIGLLAIPSLLAAFAESRPPRVAAILALVSVGLVFGAVQINDGGYSVTNIPDVFYNVIGRYFR
ncbi:hypothetical protein EOK75_07895 [Pseudorhodobacter turbinis]|uniref:50S ribosomal protein L35 n=1 Tax=Pseudorhodobacter turbinis TaxID=2500533 RepID=A0A4P8EFM4_9RHOB|nr:hypothetical protein [Pseudorhodobacter turbinis]QCO55668.1 hypothetical protein EOK75_07895 [Pseudorhodobacter turbinis]